MFAAMGNVVKAAATYVTGRAVKVLGKKTVAIGSGAVSAVGATALAGSSALVKSPVAQGLVGGAVGTVVGGALLGGGGPRRRRKRRFPTANQMARFEQAKDIMKGNPSMRRQLEYRFFSRYSWF